MLVYRVGDFDVAMTQRSASSWSSSAPSRTELELGAGGVVPIPQQTPHEPRSSGPGVLCAVGFFATASPVSTFDEPVMPGGTRVRGTTR
jgi:hypothetical protein